MGVALHLYQQLRDAPDDDSRAKAIAYAFGQLEERCPNLQDIAMQGNLRGAESRLQKEIQVVQREIKDVEMRLTQTIHRQTYWIIGSVGRIIGFIRLLDWFLSSLPK